MRTQFLKRMVEFTEQIGKPIQLLYYPPYHSKYNPFERCWGILELHWNGAKLINVETMLAWAQSMTWKGLQPIIQFSQKVYEKAILFGIIIAYTVNCDFSNLNRVALPWEQDVPEPQSGGEAGASGERLHPNS